MALVVSSVCGGWGWGGCGASGAGESVCAPRMSIVVFTCLTGNQSSLLSVFLLSCGECYGGEQQNSHFIHLQSLKRTSGSMCSAVLFFALFLKLISNTSF